MLPDPLSQAIHSELGGSGASRWTRCSGSIRMNRGRADNSGEYAAEGRLAHALAEHCLKTSVSAYDAVEAGFSHDVADPGQEPDERFPDLEMARFVQEYLDRCNDYYGEYFIEPRVSFLPWVNGWGYIDFLCFYPAIKRMVIRDLKYGQGVQVDAEENEQLLLYAIGAIEEYGMLYDVEKIVLEIDQPRLDHVSSWEISYVELMQRAAWFKERAEATQDPDAPLTPGEKQCLWCGAKAECRALADYTFRMVVDDFDDIEEEMSIRKSETLTLEEIGHVLAHKKLIHDFLNAVETKAFEVEFNGGDVPGFKVVAGRSYRQWGLRDDDVAVALASFGLEDDDIWTRKLSSVAQVEKKVGKKAFTDFDHMVVKPEGKPTLVPDSDPRPALSNVIDDFDFD